VVNIKMRGAEHVARALRDKGIETVFSLSGNQIMPVYDALFGTGIRIIHTRHEGSAVYMAEAAAQITGNVGIVLITAAPGFANGLSAMYTARASETPLVILSGDSPLSRDGRGAFQELDQCTAASALVKASFRAAGPSGLYDDVIRAIELAQCDRPGPVHLALPDDVLRSVAIVDTAATVIPRPIRQVEATATADLIEEIQAAVADSASPMFLGGPAFCRPSGKCIMRNLSAHFNVPAVTFESPRGLRAPRLGAFAEVAGKADLVVTFDKPLDFMIGFGDAPILNSACNIIQIDPEAEVLARDRTAHAERNLRQHCASSAVVIRHLLATKEQVQHGANIWREEVESAIAYRPPSWERAPTAGPINSLCFATAISTYMASHPDATLIIDGGEIGQWSQALADADVAIINGPSGAIGASIPYAIGAQVARSDAPVLSVMGDGTAGFYLAEFETAVRTNTPFVALIGNDAKWNAEHQIQLRDYGEERAFACELTPARYDRVATELGGYGEHITEVEHILPAIDRAFASGKPACINVSINGQAAPAISRK